MMVRMFSLVSSSVTTMRRRVWRSLVIVASPTMVEFVYCRVEPAEAPPPPPPVVAREVEFDIVEGRAALEVAGRLPPVLGA